MLPDSASADRKGVRTFLLVLCCLSLTAADTALPNWLAPFPQAQSDTATPSNYTARASAADVAEHYESQMRAKGISFKVENDGIGISILATEGQASAVVRIRDNDRGSIVRVSYTINAASPPQTTQPPAPQVLRPGKRVPTSMLTHAPYTWTMQSVLNRGTHPTTYSAYYYIAATNAIVERPLPAPLGATIVDVFPDDCEFSMRDDAGNSLTFRNAKDALGKTLKPGTWSLYPIKCGGIDVFLRE